MGGFEEDSYDRDAISSVEWHDEKQDSWEEVESMSIRGRIHPGVGVLGGHMYVLGGEDTVDGNTLSSVERFDEKENTWEEVASMNTTRWDVGVGVLGERIYAVGGMDTSSVEYYDEKKNRWVAVASMNITRGGARVWVCWAGVCMHGDGGC